MKKQQDLTLWYTAPAPNTLSGWESFALPLGCGYMGAMVFGGAECEKIQITENSLCNPYGPDKDSFREGLNNFAETYIEFPHKDFSDYRRSLSLDTATAEVSYLCGTAKYKREYFASYPDAVFAMRFTADKPQSVSFLLRPEIPYLRNYNLKEGDGKGKSGNTEIKGNRIILSGKMEYYNINFEAQYRVYTNGGIVLKTESGLRVENADSAVILLAVGTNYHLTPEVFLKPDKEKLDRFEFPHERVSKILDNAERLGFDALRERHINDYRALFGRVSLNLYDEFPDCPTDELLRRYKKGKKSRYLESLYFQYGRYLLISSSRKGCLPANLQGIWNVYNSAPWSAGYWHNINQQMNYWLSFPTNLSELFEPYADFNEAFRPLAEKKADEYLKKIKAPNRKQDGENGWIIGTGAWPYNVEGLNPDSHSGPGTGAFTSMLFWDWYDFTRDKNTLREHTYPAVLGTAKFLRNILTEKDGFLLASPSASPEQAVKGRYYHTVGCAFDQQMIYENAKETIGAAEALGENSEIIEELKTIIGKLDPVQIGRSGQIKEFREEKRYGQIGEKKHRHISQLVGLYPGTLINSNTPEWIKAAKVTLKKRGDKATGWAMAHRLNAWARTGDGEHSYKILKTLLKNGTLPNLLDTHPPFQIDGNFGGTSGIAEMLLQSHEGVIRPLPAIPKRWKDGEFKGLTARGNFVVGASWTNLRLKKLQICSRAGAECIVSYPQIAKYRIEGPEAEIIDSSNIRIFIAKDSECILSLI